MTNSLATVALSITLGLFFIFVGLVKITPNINEDFYRDWRNEFGRYNRVFPLARFTKWRPFARNWRLTVGITEVICGLILVLIPGRLKNLANMLLLVLMFGAFYTHIALGDKFERIAPSLMFGILLSCRLLIVYQTRKTFLEPTTSTHQKSNQVDEIDNEAQVKSQNQSSLSQIYRDNEEKKIK